MRYFMIDRIDEFKKFSYAIGTKCISLSDDVFEHHFPGQPIYPGAMLIESMAQLGGALMELSLRDDNDFLSRCVLSSVKSKFRDFVIPGDKLTMRADIVSHHEDSARIKVIGERDGKKICQADIIYVLVQIDDQNLEDSRQEFLDVLARNARVES